VIEKFFPGVVETRSCRQLLEAANVIAWGFEPKGLRVTRKKHPGSNVLSLFRGFTPEARQEASLDLFQRICPALEALHEQGLGHGAVHPHNILYSERLHLVDTGINRARMFAFGAGPIAHGPQQLDYGVWMWAATCPRELSWDVWDLVSLLWCCTLLASGEDATPWDALEMLDACEEWAEAAQQQLPAGSHDLPRLKRAYATALTAATCCS